MIHFFSLSIGLPLHGCQSARNATNSRNAKNRPTRPGAMRQISLVSSMASIVRQNIPPAGAGYASRLAPWCATIIAGGILLSSAHAQVTVSGKVTISGNVTISVPAVGGGPLTYTARTDNCVDGSQTGCLGGATGTNGATLAFQERSTDTVPTAFAATTISSGSCPSGLTPSAYPAYCPAPMNTMTTDPDFGATLVMATDDSLNNNATPWDTSWGEGSAGQPRFSQEEKLVETIGSNGNITLLNVDPVSIHAGTCASSPCVSKTGLFSVGGATHGDTTHFAANASLVASQKPFENSTFYELDTNGTSLLVNSLVITSTMTPNTATISRTAYADYVNGTGGFGGVFPAIVVGGCTSNYNVLWNGTFQVASDGSTGMGLGGGYDWCASWTPADTVGNTIFIVPLTSNPGSHGYQATTISGATGATEPVWNGAGCTAYTAGSTCTDGSVTWTDIGSVNGQGPGFDVVDYRPGLGYSRMNTRLAKIYRGSGNGAPAGAVTTFDPVACTRVLGTPCTSTPVNLPDEYTLHGANQFKNGLWVAPAPTGALASNPPGNWNSGTLTCQPNGASDVWAGAWASGTTYAAKQTVSYTDTTSAYYVSNAGGNVGNAPRTGGVVDSHWTQQEAYCAEYYWNVATTLVQPTTAWASVGGHAVGGYINQYFGTRYAAAAIGNPSAQASPPNGPITLNPGTNVLATALPSDDHPSTNQYGTGDLQPIFAALDDVPAWNTRYQVANGACYDEVCAFANVVTGAAAKTWRFAHVYNTNNILFFSNQDNIGSVSPQGDLFIVGSDFMGTRGDRRTAFGSTQSQNLRGMFSPSPTSLNLNDTIYPSSSNAGNYVYQTTIAGSTNGGAPTGGWCQTLNCTATWGTASPATVQNIGANTNRGDVMIVDLLSAKPATGNVINAASCSAANVISAIASASPGDTVNVPSGTCTWTTPSSFNPTVVLNKAITLQGQTTCTGAGATVTCTDHTIIQDNTGTQAGEDPLSITASNARVTGFTFTNIQASGDSKYMISTASNTTGWRIDHNKLTSNTSTTIHGIGAFGFGLIDHNLTGSLNTAVDIEGSDSRDGTYQGDYNWSHSLGAGTANAVYIEANEFAFASGVLLNGAIDCYAGGRFVSRFNDFKNTNWGNHGLDSTTNARSCLLVESYNNTYANAGTHIFQWSNFRGGVQYVFDETVSATGGSYDRYLDLRNYRADNTLYQWGQCGGSNVIDQNTASQHGWACRDQVGRGPETAPSTDWPVNTSTPSYSEASFPSYFWGNSWKGATPTSAVVFVCDNAGVCNGSGDASLFQIINNRDFFYEASAFNGTSGTGTGTLASRPATCTTGVAYWATDQGSWNLSGSGGQGVLYVCTATNTWTLYYTPYTYPHP